MSLVVAIDGPVAAGKGTLAKELARHFGFAYLDSGLLYRATAARLLRQKADPANPALAEAAARALTPADLAAPELRSEAVGGAASIVAAIPPVRAALLDYQRDFARKPPGGEPGAVLDGRDIGTVVCPDARVKIFVTASDEVRAGRRHRELVARGESVSFDQVLADLRERDARDAARTVAPLKPALDAHLLDTSNLAIEAAFRAACDLIAPRLKP